MDVEMEPTTPAAAPPAGPGFRLERELQELYGPEAGGAQSGIRAALGRHGAGPAGPAGRRSWTERDAVLVTYANQVTSPGERPLRTLHGFLRQHLAGLVNTVHVLPPFPSTSDDGFAVVDHTSVDPALGTWGELSAIARDFGLMLDVVLNHVSASHPWLAGFLAGDPRFARFFIEVPQEADLTRVVRPRSRPLVTTFASPEGPRRLWTTFSPDQVDLDYRNPEVLVRLVDVVLGYVAHGVSFLRLDAVGYSWKEPGTSSLNLDGAHRLVRVLRAALDEVAPSVALVTETNVPQEANVAYFGDGSDEAQAVYQFALPPLVLHAFLTGEAERLATWLDRLEPPPPGCTFLNFLGSHDGIGVLPAEGLLEMSEVDALVEAVVRHGGLVSTRDTPDGERPYELNATVFDALSDPAGGEPEELRTARFMAAESLMLTLRGVPAIYVHSLFGSPNDRAEADATGVPRSINRARFDRAALEATLADPRSRPRRILEAHARMVRARSSLPAFSPDAPQRVLEAPPGILAIERGDPALGAVTCLVNVTPEPRTMSWRTDGTDLLTGNQLARDDRVLLGPYEVLWLSAGTGRP
jgi:glucosylglycerate phosphorylase